MVFLDKEDVINYIRMKSPEDYTIEDIINVFRSGYFKELSFEFLRFMVDELNSLNWDSVNSVWEDDVETKEDIFYGMEDEEVNGIIERFLDSYIDHLTEEIIWQTTREDENIGGRVLVSLIGGFVRINGLINKMVTEDKRKELEYKSRIGLKERVYKELGIEEDISYQEGTLEFSVKGGFEIYNRDFSDGLYERASTTPEMDSYVVRPWTHFERL